MKTTIEKKPAKEKEPKKVGIVKSFFSNINVAAIHLDAPLSVGDKIQIRGHTTDFKQTVDSMQIDREPIEEALKGSEVGIKVKDRVRPNDIVYKL